MEQRAVRDPKSVAIVDDDEEVRNSLGTLLRSYGVAASAFTSAEAFLCAPDLSGFDCLVTDVFMPGGMSGLEMLEALRGSGCGLPAIVISALDPERTRVLAMAKGADAFLAKPVDPDALMDCMRRVLAPRGGQRGSG